MPSPTPVGKPSLQPSEGLWQLAQLIQFEPESRGSKKSILPSSIRSGVGVFSAGEGTSAGNRNKRLFATTGGPAVLSCARATEAPRLTNSSPIEHVTKTVFGFAI